MCKENKDIYKELQESPMFQLSLASKELFHSNFLAWIGSWDFGNKKKRGKDHPFRQLMSALGASHALDDSIWGDQWYVAREYRNFDLCVLDRMPEEFEEPPKSQDNDTNNTNKKKRNSKQQPKILLIVENKVKSIPYIEQLHEYQRKVLENQYDFKKAKKDNSVLRSKWELKISASEAIKRKIPNPDDYAATRILTASTHLKVDFLLLSMSKDFPDLGQIKKEDIWKVVNYQDYIKNIRSICLDKKEYKFLISDYCNQMENLLQLHEKWTNSKEYNKFLISPSSKDYKELKKLRIHDLCQKQRYAKMCGQLKSSLENVFKHHGIRCVPKIDLAKGSGNWEKTAIIDFNYLHGEPLLDIWLGTKDFVYTIQVQGDRYEHGIQKLVKSGVNQQKGDNARKLWEEEIWRNPGGIGYSNAKWNWICPFDNSFIAGGKILKDGFFPIICKSIFAGDCVFPDKTIKRKGSFYPFLKYELDNGITFIYQYRKISDSATVNEVLDYIVADFEALCNMILGKP